MLTFTIHKLRKRYFFHIYDIYSVFAKVKFEILFLTCYLILKMLECIGLLLNFH